MMPFKSSGREPRGLKSLSKHPTKEIVMLKHLVAAAVAGALIAVPAASSFAQSPAAKTEKKLTPQQQKMKDCSAKWADYKKEKNVKGKAEHNKFMGTCLKG